MTLQKIESSPKVSIVVLNYKNYKDTMECLHSLAKITYPNVETIVVDNDSQNDSLGHIHKNLSDRQVGHVVMAEDAIETSGQIKEKIILLQSASNRGYAAGNNLGIRVALTRGADYVLLLNNDTLVDKGFLEPLVVYADEHVKIGAVGPKILDGDGLVEPTCARRRPTLLFYLFGHGIGRKLLPNNRWWREHFYQGEYFFDHPKEVDVISGACLLIRREVFSQLGLLDENTFMYLEEFILHEKMRDAGLGQAIVPDSTILHKGGKSTGSLLPEHIRKAKQESRRYYLTHYRHYGRFTLFAIMLSRDLPSAFLRKLWNDRRKVDAP